MPISCCHFRDCKALLVTSLTYLRSSIASTGRLSFRQIVVHCAFFGSETHMCVCVCVKFEFIYNYYIAFCFLSLHDTVDLGHKGRPACNFFSNQCVSRHRFGEFPGNRIWDSVAVVHYMSLLVFVAVVYSLNSFQSSCGNIRSVFTDFVLSVLRIYAV